MTTFGEAYTYCLANATEDEVSRLSQALRERAKMHHSLKSNLNAATLSKGVKVRLTGLSPKYLNGLLGTVGRVNGKKIVVEFETPLYQGRFFGTKTVTIPASCVEVVS